MAGGRVRGTALCGGADAEPTRQLEGLVDGGEGELGAIAAARGSDVNLGAEGLPESVRDVIDRLRLIWMDRPAARPTAPPAVACVGGGGAGAGLELTHRHGGGGGLAGELAADVVVLGHQQRAAMALCQVAALDQLERLVGEVEQPDQVRHGDATAPNAEG